MQFSNFGNKFTAKSGILGLMDDLGSVATSAEKSYLLGGGNPARIPEVEAAWVDRLTEICQDRALCGRLIGCYDGPQGRASFLEALAGLFEREYGWKIGPENIALTNGSQSAFFMLFNLFAGRYPDGRDGKVLFPLVPEYVGYADQSRFSADFSVNLPRIEERGGRRFKYRVSFDDLPIDDSVTALCASRPTNPTGNVLTDDEVIRLASIARERGIPFLLDGAYGLPFPSIIFTDAQPFWNEDIILCMSLSKIGLPSLRTGIVIARREVIEALSAMNTILSLANGSIGPEIMLPFVSSGEVLRISNNLVRPFYAQRSRATLSYIDTCFAGTGVDWSIHESEGAIFLWLWFRNLPISTMELYERLKTRRVFVIPGRYFFFGEAESWAHRDECLRLNYSQDEADVKRGIEIMAEEIAKAMRELR